MTEIRMKADRSMTELLADAGPPLDQEDAPAAAVPATAVPAMITSMTPRSRLAAEFQATMTDIEAQGRDLTRAQDEVERLTVDCSLLRADVLAAEDRMRQGITAAEDRARDVAATCEDRARDIARQLVEEAVLRAREAEVERDFLRDKVAELQREVGDQSRAVAALGRHKTFLAMIRGAIEQVEEQEAASIPTTPVGHLPSGPYRLRAAGTA